MPNTVVMDDIQRMLVEYELSHSHVELLHSTDHFNAKIVTKSEIYFLKILGVGYSEARLTSQFRFTDFLRDGGLSIPAPVATVAGRRFARLGVDDGRRLGALFPWIEGETLGDRVENHWLERCGELLARLHVQAQRFEPPPEFETSSWDEVYAPPDGGWLDSILAELPIDSEGRAIIRQVVSRTRDLVLLLQCDRESYGLIHADFHGENLIFDGKDIWIVDCEDFGWGHLLFDVAWSALLFAKHHPNSKASFDSFRKGYERIRPLSSTEIELLPVFQLAAGICALEMIDTSSVEHEDPVSIAWFDFIIRWLQSNLV